MNASEGRRRGMLQFAVGMAFGLAALFAAIPWAIPSARADGGADERAIPTASGPLRGILAGPIKEYLGIPYAAAPAGALRWMPPQPFGRWHGVFSANAFGSVCPQTSGGDEDCLFLNVYTPSETAGSQEEHDEYGRGHEERAVMVWIHGGGLTQGAGSDFDPTPLVEEGGVVVVTLNYRLGLLGFLAHPALDSEGHLAGNYGLMDQQFALAWVQQNIRAFGGDAERVTIFGESAGGLSVYAQLASPLSAGLFARAIAQSGAYASFADYLGQIVPIAQAETTGTPVVESGVAIAAALGCTSQTAACLRGVAESSLVSLTPHTVYPFVDAILLAQTPGAAFDSGNFNRVPVTTGTNHDEYRFQVAEDYDLKKGVGPLKNADYASAIAAAFRSLTPAQQSLVLAAYPLPPGAPADAASLALGAAGTDGIFACTARHALQALAQYVTIYAYEFNDENAPPPAGFPALSFPLGAYHSADVQYLFDRLGVAPAFTTDQEQLSDAMISYWTHFAKRGDPNSADRPFWAPYDPATDERMSFVPPKPAVESGFAAAHQCALWDLF
jgi:para-nitrobenzyl esterase